MSLVKAFAEVSTYNTKRGDSRKKRRMEKNDNKNNKQQTAAAPTTQREKGKNRNIVMES